MYSHYNNFSMLSPKSGLIQFCPVLHILQQASSISFSPAGFLHTQELHLHRVKNSLRDDTGRQLTIFFNMLAVILKLRHKLRVMLPDHAVHCFVILFRIFSDFHCMSPFFCFL